MKRVAAIPLFTILLFGCQPEVEEAEGEVGGIVEYTFEEEPGVITPKRYNWEVLLTEAESREGSWVIGQVTEYLDGAAAAAAAESKVLVDAEMIVPNQGGRVHFMLRAGDKEPTPNMGATGNIGQPLVFSGLGTGVGVSSWIVLPGAEIEEVVPSEAGAEVVDGTLRMMRFVGVSAAGDRFRSDVVLRRE